MPTIITHAVTALALPALADKKYLIKKLLLLSVILSILPDADVLTFYFNVPYDSFWGHRGFFHSLFFGFLISGFFTYLFFKKDNLRLKNKMAVWGLLFAVIASHGIFDAMTNGGYGIALFSPFTNQRFFLPWTPIEVSPIGLSRFLSERGAIVLWSEIKWIWFPLAGLLGARYLIQKLR